MRNVSEKGVRRLAGAMLLQAVEDAGSSSVGTCDRALRWMNSKDNGCFSFAFVCRVLGRDPAEVRHFCEHQAAKYHQPKVSLRMMLRDPSCGGWWMRV